MQTSEFWREIVMNHKPIAMQKIYVYRKSKALFAETSTTWANHAILWYFNVCNQFRAILKPFGRFHFMQKTLMECR